MKVSGHWDFKVKLECQSSTMEVCCKSPNYNW